MKTATEICKEYDKRVLDDIYRIVLKGYVTQDIEEFAESENLNLDKDTVSLIADRYVYDGKYDCNQSYWDNIKNLITEVAV